MTIQAFTLCRGFRGFQVELYCATISAPPHGFEVTRDNTTNVSGYHATGALTVEDGELVDYDGVATLPLAVAQALESIGVQVHDECLSDAAIGWRRAQHVINL